MWSSFRILTRTTSNSTESWWVSICVNALSLTKLSSECRAVTYKLVYLHVFKRTLASPPVVVLSSPPLKVRAIAFPSLVTILFYCLDPVFPGLSHASALDVDGFLTNSNSIKTFLLKSAPTALIPLAVDTKAFPFYPESPVPSVAGVGRREEDNQRKTSIVFVGAAGAMKYKEMLAWMLREALPYGLDIYGTGWQNVAEFSANWRGVLPEKDLASV